MIETLKMAIFFSLSDLNNHTLTNMYLKLKTAQINTFTCKNPANAEKNHIKA